MPNRWPSIKPMNRTINIQQLKKRTTQEGGHEVHTCQALADTMTTKAGMGVGGWMEKPSHAVSTCSPDCPTDSAVERALVDLEWRREAAGKRNGNTHRVNTQVPEVMQGLLPPRPRFSWRNGAGYEWTAGLTPHCMMATGLTQLLHTQAWHRHSLQCYFILRTHWRTQTPGLDSHTKLPPAVMEISHMKNIRGQSTIWTQGGQREDGVSTGLTRWVTGMWCICHHAPKTKAERFPNVISTEIHG